VGQNKFPYKRAIVFGSTGMGKTTLVKQIADDFSLPVIDIDSLRREAGKSASVEETFSRLVSESIKGDTWIIDGSYTSVQDIVWTRAEAIIWMDFSFWVFLSRLAKRSLYRIFVRKKSEKPIKGRYQPAGERTSNYLRAILTGKQRQRHYFATLYSSEYTHLHIIRLSSPEEATNWINLLKNDQSK
jgi:adenylate kinase family enzyme